MSWTKTKSKVLPKKDTAVLIVVNGEIHVGILRWEYPSLEEDFKAFPYWDDPYDEGRLWLWHEVTHWMHLPELP